MSFQKQTTSAKETPGYTPEEGGIVSLIDLAANLDDPLYRRAIGKLSIGFDRPYGRAQEPFLVHSISESPSRRKED